MFIELPVSIDRFECHCCDRCHIKWELKDASQEPPVAQPVGRLINPASMLIVILDFLLRFLELPKAPVIYANSIRQPGIATTMYDEGTKLILICEVADGKFHLYQLRSLTLPHTIWLHFF